MKKDKKNMNNNYKIITEFEKAFKTAVYSKENRIGDYEINWNFVDADLCLDGWNKKIGKDFYKIFDRMATSQEMDMKWAHPKVLIG